MLECSGAASAVNADVMCCKDDLSIAFSFICIFFLRLFVEYSV